MRKYETPIQNNLCNSIHGVRHLSHSQGWITFLHKDRPIIGDSKTHSLNGCYVNKQLLPHTYKAALCPTLDRQYLSYIAVTELKEILSSNLSNFSHPYPGPDSDLLICQT